MADAAAQEQTGMSAILGGDRDAVLALLDELDLTPANHNGAGQIVAAGALDALAASPLTRRRQPRHSAAGGRRVPHLLHGTGGRHAARRGRGGRGIRPGARPLDQP
jgi:[acyl-carrier-protein] S-malonyltransferase